MILIPFEVIIHVHGYYYKSSDYFECPPKSLLKSSQQKNTFQIFLSKKISCKPAVKKRLGNFANNFYWFSVFLTFYSAELKCDMNFAVYVPPQAASEKVPVLYWLSGNCKCRCSLLFFVPFFSAPLVFPLPPLSAPGFQRMVFVTNN